MPATPSSPGPPSAATPVAPDPAATISPPPSHGRFTPPGPPPAVVLVPDTPPERGLTWRAVLIALIGVVSIVCYSDINDNVVRAGPTLAGNQLPFLPMLLVVLAGSVWNPLAGRLSARLKLRTRELAVSMILMMSVSWIAGVGQLRALPGALVLPWLQQPAHVTWQQAHTLEYLPARAVPLAHDHRDPAYDRVFGDAASGITSSHGKVISWRQVPWRAWVPALACWVPLLFLIALALFALAMLMHRQWSRHEMLAYPLATVMASVLPGPGGTLPPLMRSPLFWIGTAPPVIIDAINWASLLTNGEYFPWIQFFFGLTDDLGHIFPLLVKAGYNGFGYFQWILVGISYFLPTEVSFSIATGYMGCMAVAIPVYLVTGQPTPGVVGKNVVSGAFLGYGLLLLVIARTYLLSVFARAIRPLRGDDPDPAGPWAARILALAGMACVAWLSTLFGMDWCIATLYVGWMLIFFLVVMRIVSETGIPFFQSEMDWGMTMANVLGLPAVGPQALVLINWLAPVLNRDNRNCLPPLAANSLKLAEHIQLRLPRLVPWAIDAVVLAPLLGVAAKLWFIYAIGVQGEGLSAPTGQGIENATQQLQGAAREWAS